MDETNEPPPLPQSVIESLEASKADIAAGRIHDFNECLAELHKRIEEHMAQRQLQPTDTARHA